MCTQPSLANQIRPVADTLKLLAALATNSATRNEFSEVVVRFTSLDAAFIPNGQYDVDVRDELRVVLKGLYVEKVAPALVAVVRQRAAFQACDPDTPSWVFLSLVDAVGKIGAAAGLDGWTNYWLRLVAYSAIVAHGPAGAALPDLPLHPAQADLPKEKRTPKIYLTVVPGGRLRGPYGDDGEEMPGGFINTHDPEDPDATDGWRF